MLCCLPCLCCCKISCDDFQNMEVGCSRSSVILLPLNLQKTRYDCLITVSGMDYLFHLYVPNYPSCRELTFYACWDLEKVLKDKIASHELNFNCDLDSFIDKIISIIEIDSPINKASPDTSLRNIADYSQVLSEIDSIGWKNLYSVNKAFTEIKLKACDSNNKEHILTVDISQSPFNFHLELPDNPILDWKPENKLSDMYKKFCNLIESYVEFYLVLETLDSNSWVLEPENPSRKDDYRKIAISSNISMKITVDTRNPTTFPTISWLGSESAVFPYREKLAYGMEMWDQDIPIHSNLEAILEITLPRKEQEDTSAYEVTCCICYSARLNGEVPSRTCDNPKCNQSFHIYCLYEWLRSLIQSRKLGNKVFGVCPYCETAISCKAPDH